MYKKWCVGNGHQDKKRQQEVKPVAEKRLCFFTYCISDHDYMQVGVFIESHLKALASHAY